MEIKKRNLITGLYLVLLIILLGTVTVEASTYTYDSLNRLTTVTYDNGQKITYSYDSGGNILSMNNEGALASSLTVSPLVVMEADSFNQTFTLTPVASMIALVQVR